MTMKREKVSSEKICKPVPWSPKKPRFSLVMLHGADGCELEVQLLLRQFSLLLRAVKYLKKTDLAFVEYMEGAATLIQVNPTSGREILRGFALDEKDYTGTSGVQANRAVEVKEWYCVK